MGSGLKLRLDKYLLGNNIPQYGVIANFYAIEGEGQKSKRNVVIPVGYSADYAEVELAPGFYLVEALLPSGDIITKEEEVREGDWKQVNLHAENSAHEWQSWHNFVGNVESQGSYANSYKARSAQPQFKVWKIQELPQRLRREDAWQTLNDWISDGTQRVFNELPALEVSQPQDQDDATQTHTFFMNGNSLPREALPRWYALIGNDTNLQFASVPAPWFELNTEQELTVELLAQQTEDRDLKASFSIPDKELCSALGYMTRGSLRAAAQLVNYVEAKEEARNNLFYKFKNPLGAAGGAYILLGTERITEERDWHEWIFNLMRHFPWLPDGAIQYAWLQLAKGSSEQNRNLARQALTTAFERGIPYYTLGLQWMVDSLTLLGDDDPDIQRMLRAVQKVSWRVDTSQTFTSITLVH